MNSFETYLIENGWVIDNQGDNRELSTLGRLDNRFVKANKQIFFGLNEHRMPPTLKSPRPTAVCFERNKTIVFPISDAQMIGILEKVDFDTVLESLFDHQILMEFESVRGVFVGVNKIEG